MANRKPLVVSTGRIVELTSSDNLDIGGSIIVTGNVDGRDISIDGGNLDTHLALTSEHIDWTNDQGTTNIHTGNYDAGIGEYIGTANSASIAISQDNTALENVDGTGYCIGMGIQAGMYVTTGNFNLALGAQTLLGDVTSKLTGSYNIGIGATNGSRLTTGFHNTLIGYKAGDNVTGIAGKYNIAVGAYALQGKVTSTYNTAGYNIAFGYYSLYAISSGGYNVGIGLDAGKAVTEGTYNICIGSQPATALTTGDNNTILGSQAGSTMTTASDNVHIGRSAGKTTNGSSGTNNYSNCISIGVSSYTTANSEMSLGNSTWISAAYTAATFSQRSDERYKIFYDMDLGLDFINSITPRKYKWKDNINKEFHYGFSAQEVKTHIPDNELRSMHRIRDNDDKEQNLSYTEFIAPMVNAIQEMSKQIEQLKQEILELKK